MDKELVVVQMTNGQEIVGRRVSNLGIPGCIGLTECLRLVPRPTPDGQVSFGLEPLSYTVTKPEGSPGHTCEIYLQDVLTLGPAVPLIQEAYQRATSVIQLPRNGSKTVVGR